MSWSDEYFALVNKKKKKGEEQKDETFENNPFTAMGRLKSQREVATALLGQRQASKLEYSDEVKKLSGNWHAPEDDGWFSKGALKDGFSLKNLAKTAVGTTRDIGENVWAGLLGMGEQAVDTGAYLIGGAGGLVGADNFRDDMQAFIQKDLYDEKEVAKKIVLHDLFESVTGIDTAEDSILGGKADALAQSAGQLAGTAALQTAGVPWFLTTGVTSFGGEVESAFNQGATYGEAGLSAAITAGAEILTEKLSGGIKFGGKTLDDVLLDPFIRGISNKTVRFLTNMGVDMAGEGFEEILSGVFSAIGQKLTYMDDKELGELFTREDAVDSFLGGMILGGGGNVVQGIKAKAHGVDAVTGLSDNEQKVFDQIYKEELAKAEKNGKLSKVEKAELYDKLMEDMEKGYISTDTIEKALGDRTAMDALQKESDEFDKLYNTASNQLSKAQSDRLAELEAKQKATPYADAVKNAKGEMSQKVYEQVKGTKLEESYREKARRGQAFQADVSRYDAKQQAVVKKAMDSGVLNNTRRTHEFVDMIAKIGAEKGISFDFTNNEKLKASGFALNGKTVNGFVSNGNVTLNIHSAKALNSVVGHEIAHVLEGTELYDSLKKTLFDYAKTKGEYQGRYDALAKLYKNVKDANIEGELVADLVGDYIFSDADFVKNLSTGNRNVFQKIFDEIKYLCKVATKGSKEARELEKVKKIFEEAYRESGKAQKNTIVEDGVRYALADIEAVTPTESEKNQNIVTVASMEPVHSVDASKLIPGEKSIKEIYQENFEAWGGNIHSDTMGDIAVKNSSIRSEMRHGSTPVKVASVEAIPSVIQNGKIVEWFKKDTGLFRIVVAAPIEIGNQPYFMGVMLQRDAQNQRLYLHDVAIEKEVLDHSQEHLDSTGPHEGTENLYTSSILDRIVEVKRKMQSPYMGKISDAQKLDAAKDIAPTYSLSEQGKSEGVKYSLSDSDGKQLTKEQQEYFKDSNIRDADGNLKVMHHGSGEAFTVFDKKKAKASGYYGNGFYFTDSESHAKQYGNTYDVYLNITNPLQDGTKNITKDQLRKFVEAVADNEDYGIENYGYGATVDSVVDSVYGKSDFAMLMDINASCIGNMVEAIELFNDVNGTDYNGIVAPTETVAFYPEQIKRTDNLNPTENEDIRYSMSEIGEQVKRGRGTYGEDIMLAPVKGAVAENATVVPAAKKPPVTPGKGGLPSQTQAEADAMVNPEAKAKVEKEYQQQKKELEDRNGWISKKASELYDEIRNLKKGVKASRELAYLLDSGLDWSSIRSALVNIKHTPDHRVNMQSSAESMAREMLGEAYEDKLQTVEEDYRARLKVLDEKAQKEIGTVTERVRQKRENAQRELDENRRLRDRYFQDYEAEIARLQAQYDAKKKKNTLAAQNILRSIERLKRLQADSNANYSKRISDLEKRVEKLYSEEYSRAEHRREKQEGYTKLWKDIIGDTSTWRDMALGLQYKIRTLRRILRKVVKDADGNADIQKADRIYDEMETKYDHNEALLKKESQKLKQVFRDLNLNHTEDTYAQMLGELRYNPETTLSEEMVRDYYNAHKNKIDSKKVDKAISEARKLYDDLIVRVNKVLKEQGFKEIPYRQGYFPHFTNPKQNWVQKALNWKPVDNEIPTSIAGLTETFKPQRSWQKFDKRRVGDTTDYSLLQGLDTYIHGALDWIYHIEDLQKRRALENYIRYTHSDEGIQARIDEIKRGDYDADEAQQMIDAVLKEGKNPLGGLVRELMNRTNTLANKKAAADRAMEDETNRKIYSTMTNLNNRITANMVVGSVSSALTNFIPMVQSWHQVSPVYTVKGLGDMVRSVINDDGMIAKSDFLTNRLMEEENLYKTGWDKVSDKAAILMNAFDNITSQTVWRSKYLQNLSEGMSENESIRDADQFAKNLMAGRSRGNAPTVFDAKNPVNKLFTAFQLEVANQYGYMFEDLPVDSVNKTRLVKGYATAFVGAYLYNALYSSLVGREAAFDPIRIIQELIGDLEDEEKEAKDIILGFGENILQEVPFVGGLLGGGRVPISSALPYGGYDSPFERMLTDVTEGNWAGFGKELLNPLYYLAMPIAGGQIKKTTEGLGMFLGDEPFAGSYTNKGDLRYPVAPTPLNVAQAALFGQYANKNARQYFDEGYAPIKVDLYQFLQDNGVSYEEYRDFDEDQREAWNWAKNNPAGYVVAKAVAGDPVAYKQYTKALSELKADKDKDGKSIPGSRKEKVIDWLNELDAEYGEKIILFKSEYPSDDTYNQDIFEYLKSRDDLSYEEKVTIFKELGFTVRSDGYVTWD